MAEIIKFNVPKEKYFIHPLGLPDIKVTFFTLNELRWFKQFTELKERDRNETIN